MDLPGLATGESPPAIVVFARLDEPVTDEGGVTSQLPRSAVRKLGNWGVRLVLVSSATAARVRQVQRQLNLAEPFVCDGGGALYVPSSYFGNVRAPDPPARDWEVFRFSPPDRPAAVKVVRDLLLARGFDDVLTIGIGCDLDDYAVLSSVDLPVVVRDPEKEQRELLRYVPWAYLTTATGVEGWSEALIGP